MKVSHTLSTYLAVQFLFWLIGVFLIFMAIAMLFDVVEMLRRTADKDEITLGLVLYMSLLKLPFLAQTTLPFMTLFAAMLTFWRLARANEAVVARAAGISAWQFILPAFLITAFLGVVAVTIINPMSAAIPAGVLCGVVRAVIERPHPSAAPDGRLPGATVSHPC